MYVAVGIGGMIGAVCRYGVSYFIPPENGFPYATLTANLIGCFLLSFLLNQSVLKQKLSPELFLALCTGVVGSFTTFSTFMVETVLLFESNLILAIGYVSISILGGLLFCFFGYRLATRKRV
ncbi:CrcB protein [Virgibacillus necropolis]|uniref:Fluoride-specific ion channel FluC n=2 Tax=Virgibacillus necropolis TaxID=163877 RepID=A0A221MB50_9BACI|nr:CrcB protein [Virgibacillus necropolis]